MKKYLSLFVFFIITLAQVHAQRTVTGVIRDETGEPLPGATIQIKGTTTGTVTDVEGNYSIVANIGDVLVIRFVGMGAREMIVTEENSTGSPTQQFRYKAKTLPIKTTTTPALEEKNTDRLRDFLADTVQKNKQDVISLQAHTKKYKWGTSNSYYKNSPQVKHIRVEIQGQDTTFLLIPTKDRLAWDKQIDNNATWNIDFLNSFEMTNAFGLPHLQNEYAQGRPNNGSLTWQGADQNEVFSWGLPIKTLFYQNDAYAYDQKGTLGTTITNLPAQHFDKNQIFQTGHCLTNALTIKRNMKNHHGISASYQRSEADNILPNQFEITNRLQLNGVINVYKARLMLLPQLSYYTQQNRLPLHGANLASVLQSTWLSPATFDDRNGLSVKEALQNSSSYLLPDNSARSFAPNSFDNPYAILSELPDRNNYQSTNVSTGYSYIINEKLDIDGMFSHTQNTHHAIFGRRPTSVLETTEKGFLTDRTETNNYLFNSNRLNFKDLHLGDMDIAGHITYTFNKLKRKLNRTDGIGFEGNYDMENATNHYIVDNLTQRQTHELSIYTYVNITNYFNVALSNNSYFSSTLAQNYIFQPTISARLEVNDFLYQVLNWYDVPSIELYASYGKTIQEMGLSYPSWHFNSINLSIQEANRFTENQELIFQNGLLPTENKTLDIGMSMRIDDIMFAAGYFYQQSKDFVLPQWHQNTFKFENVGTLLRQGIELSGNYEHHLGWRGKWRMDYQLTFSLIRPVVKDVYTENYVPIAGFESIQTAFIKDQPYGVLLGTAYQRNENGQVVIGDEGFPLVAEDLQIIGNPNPDFTLNLLYGVSWKEWKIQTNWQWQKGGDIWNGTQQQLDYYGRSQTSADLRQTRNYLFEGVRQDGTPNNTLVNFADESLPIEQNRWVRYGSSGIAEDYIESASFLRLHEIKLNYYSRIAINEQSYLLNISLFAQNLLVFTPYQGSLPQTNLFGYSEGSGLDFFNLPNVRRFGVALKITL